MFCAALPQEIKHFCRILDIKMPDKHNLVSYKRITQEKEIGVAVSGVGQSRMRNLLESLSGDDVTYWISIGFAGGLDPALHPGDCIIGNKVINSSGGVYSCQDECVPATTDSSHILYCADKVVATQQEKSRLFETTGASAVDMESAAVAWYAQKRGERFAWIRVISDAAGDMVPEAVFDCISKDGFPSSLAAIKTILFNPLTLKPFIKLGLRSAMCSRNLSKEIHASGLLGIDA